MSGNAFLKDKSFYNRDINPLRNYVSQMATALSVSNGVSFEEAKAFIENAMRTKQFKKLHDPMVEFFGRDENGDRTREELPLTHYIRDTVQKKQILVPTFTCYVHPDEDKSPLSVFIGVNVATRAKAKHAAQEAEGRGDMETYFFQNVAQTNKKENNNSLSGSFATDSSVFENDTGHNTLTSITRSMASIGNALNERMIGGNRHYRNKNIALNNIIAIVHTADYASIDEAVAKFNLHLPTPEEVVDVIKHSMRFYVFDKQVYQDLLTFVQKLTPQQRAAVVYNQDFFHIRKYNPEFVRSMLDKFSAIDFTARFEDPIKIIKGSDGLTVNYAHQVCIEMVKGLAKDYSKMSEETQHALAYVCQNIDSCVDNYRSVINAFFLTKTTPNSTAYIQDMVRQDVVLSDTDSTMFSVDEWVDWYFGKLDFSQKGYGVAGAVMFMSTQCIAHCLAILSGNMGVADEHLYTLQMKPEFVFPVFVQSPVAKHYFTAMLVKEGAVYKDIRMEIKGVHNKNSALPASIIEPVHARMEELIRKVMQGEKVSIEKEIKDVADIERTIIESLKNSEVDYLKRGNLKEASAYGTGPESSPYAHHVLWEKVFAPKYGEIEPPPYDVVKVPTILTSPTKFKKWISEMLDRDLAARLEAYSTEFNKKQMPTFFFSSDQVISQSIPQEVIDVIDYRKIVLDLTNVRRMLLDSLGFPVRVNYLLSELGY